MGDGGGGRCGRSFECILSERGLRNEGASIGLKVSRVRGIGE